MTKDVESIGAFTNLNDTEKCAICGGPHATQHHYLKTAGGGIDTMFFSPMGREYCVYFLWLTIIAFVFFAIAVFDVVITISKGKGNIFRSLLSLIFPFLIYFNNRLLYSMCVK